jgi:hypothetical protein
MNINLRRLRNWWRPEYCLFCKAKRVYYSSGKPSMHGDSCDNRSNHHWHRIWFPIAWYILR